MSVSPDQVEKLRQAWLNEKTPEWKDFWLDRYNDYLKNATNHDAQKWGFDATNWMLQERLILAGRGGINWPKEAT